MNNVQLIITAGLLALFLVVNQLAGGNDTCTHCYGGLPWYGWGSGIVVLFIAGVVFARRRGEGAHRMLVQRAPAPAVTPQWDERWNESLWRKYDSDGPAFPHPVIIAERCIGCHACVESCPHDVLTISFTKSGQPVASVVDPDLCLEDTSCEAACPVNPKACIVVNTMKKVRSLPMPPRDSNTYESEKVRGCYVIGDVSGIPLIKNAANEGVAVMVHLANELHATGGVGAPPKVDCEVAIIGAGPAGLSAAIMAKRLGLKCICIEQDTVMSTIVKYSKNKYVFFKPQTTAWAGAIHLPGLEEYVEEVLEEVLEEPERGRIAEMLEAERAAEREERKPAEATRSGGELASEPENQLAPEIARTLEDARKRYQQLLTAEVKARLAAKLKDTPAAELNETLAADARERLKRARERFEALLDGEDKYLLGQLLADERAGKIKDEDARSKSRLALARRQYGDQLEATIAAGKLSEARFKALADARRKVAGDQREVLLNTWFLNAEDNCVEIYEKESCKSVKKAEDGDYFNVKTEKEKAEGEKKAGAQGDEDNLTTYRARRVVLAIGNSSSPTRLKVGKEEVNIKVKYRDKEGKEKEKEKVQYRLSDPKEYTKLKLIVVGGGNSAVEAAVDLVTWRKDTGIDFRPDAEQNEVTMLVRGADFKTDVKFGNKQQLYRCIDRGLIKLRRNTEIKEVSGDVVVTKNLETGKVDPPLKNDFIFALIGSQRPAALLTQNKMDGSS